MRLFLSAILFLSICGCGSSKPVDPVVHDFSDKDMDAAIEQAKLSQKDFNTAVVAKRGEYHGVKHGFETKDGGKEHCWVGYVIIQGDEYVGKMENIPQNLKAPIKPGSDVRIKQTDISDWLIKDGKKLYGAYTNRVLDKGAKASDLPYEYADIKDLK